MVALLLGLLATRTAEPAPEPPPAVSLELAVQPSGPSGSWKVVVTNTSGVPVRLAADARLLRLEMDNPAHDESAQRARKGRRAEPKTLECKLPAEMVPSNVAEDRALFLPPGAKYEEIVDPALYCFEQRERDALAAGVTLTPKLGWAIASPPAKPTEAQLKKARLAAQQPPFVAEPTESLNSVSPTKELVGRPFTVPAAAAPERSLSAAGLVDPQDPGAPRLEVITPARLDAYDAGNVDLTVTVKNVGKRAAVVRMRRDHLLFDVEGPSGAFRCGAVTNSRTIPTDLFASLKPGATDSVTLRLPEPCPDKAFDRPGIYRIRTMLVLPEAADRPGPRPLSGRFDGPTVTVLRVRTGPAPFHASRPAIGGAE